LTHIKAYSTNGSLIEGGLSETHGRCSSVVIATSCSLDIPGFESRWWRERYLPTQRTVR
jgi:hypothetical protein